VANGDREAEAGAEHVEHHHADVQGGAARAAVFGVSDGLVSNLGLMLGVAGADPQPGVVRLAGLAGLIAGAVSMAAGEYNSMRVQSELLQRELRIEARELRRRPRAETAELTRVYERRGLDPEQAHDVAAAVMRDPANALEVHAREELGIDPGDLPSPAVAAASSFGSFALGALLPVLPYLLGATALWPAVLLALLGLFACGAVVARVTARSWWYSGLRQLALGGAAAGVTYALGSLFGAAV
jgi:vacuolar iron transporter family protein